MEEGEGEAVEVDQEGREARMAGRNEAVVRRIRNSEGVAAMAVRSGKTIFPRRMMKI